MNRIYKVIWSKAKHCYTVVSEIAKSQTRSPSVGRGETKAALLAAAVLTGGLLSGMPVWAEAAQIEGGVVSKGQYLAFATNAASGSTTMTVGDKKYNYTVQTLKNNDHTYHFYVRDGYTLSFEEGSRYTGSDTYPYNQLQLITTKGTDADEGGLLLTYINDFNPNDVKNTHGQTLTNWDGNRYGGGVIGQNGVPHIGAQIDGNYYVMVDGDKKYLTSASGNKLENGTGFVKFEKGTYSYDPVKHEFTYKKDGQTWTVSGDDVYSLTEGEKGDLGFFLYKGNVYTNHIYGWNNEILQTGIGEDGKWYSYWGTEVVDPNQKIGEMTYQKFSEIMNHFDTNDTVLAGRDIASIKAEQNTDETKPPTGSLQFWSAPQYDANGKVVEGSTGNKLFQINVSNTGGGVYGDETSKAGDVKIHFSTLMPVYGTDGKITGYTDGGSFAIDAGSKVVAVTNGEDSNSLTGLTINGEEYSISSGSGTNAGVEAGKNIAVAGPAEDTGNYTVSLKDDITLGDHTYKKDFIRIDGDSGNVAATGYIRIGTEYDSSIFINRNGTGDITGLKNIEWSSGYGGKTGYAGYAGSGRAATEGQLYTAFSYLNTKIDGITINGSTGIAPSEGSGNAGTGGNTGSGTSITGSGTIQVKPTGPNEGNDSPGWQIDVNPDLTLGNKEGTTGSLTVAGKDSQGKETTITVNGKDDNGHNTGTVNGLTNKTWNPNHFVSGQAATEDQLGAVQSQVTNNTNAINTIYGDLNHLGNRVDQVGAGAAALAALHPLDFDPDDKWDFAAGYGNYAGANAVALGMYYRPNEDTMFSVGGSMGGGENMVNAGVSFKLGQGNNVSTSRVAMAKEIKDLRKELEEMRSLLADTHARKPIDPSKLQLFPDVPANHWAYEYIAQMAGNGILEGYPDGNFRGDRPMTRYEFAAMLYRAMEKGARLSDRLLTEFAPELERFTVDTVAKDKDGNPTIQRVRVVKGK